VLRVTVLDTGYVKSNIRSVPSIRSAIIRSKSNPDVIERISDCWRLPCYRSAIRCLETTVLNWRIDSS